ncbi:MAG: hypothetical protein HZA24_11735 [Nitrospirae bacterium]|nr:hypothetical protein [Nitrospirota bacterium]
MSIPVIECIKRCTANPAFLDRFYELFTSNPAVREKFSKTDFDRQKYLLGHMLVMLIKHAYGLRGADERLTEVARRHGTGDLNIPRYMYNDWIDCLVRAVRETEPNLPDEVMGDLRRVMEAEVATFISRAENPTNAPAT